MPDPMRRRTLLAAGVAGAVAAVVGPAAVSSGAAVPKVPTTASAPIGVAELEQSTFAPAVGGTFSVRSSPRATTNLVLTSVEPLPNGPPGPRRFSLMFEGSNRPVLSQGIYAMSNAGIGSFEIFIAPVGLPGTIQSYQAIFDA